MATISLLPSKAKIEAVKRSMTHPLRDPKSSGAKRGPKMGEPFDPEELSRLLNAHLEEQRLKSEKRRAARLAKATAAQQQEVYHHVPKVAAAAFERTTTPDVLRHVHKLSQPAIKHQLERLSIEDPNPQLTSLQKMQALDKATIERYQLRNRNQFQWSHDMEDAAEVDLERDVYRLPRRTFDSEFAYLKNRHSKGVERPLSTGDVISEEDEPPITSNVRLKPKLAFDGRNDWAQQGEDNERRVRKEKSSPLVRKKDSIWILRKGKEKQGKQDKDDAGSPPDGSKIGRISFLDRFKRHPS